MVEPGKHELIIVRRYEEEEHESHNTAWKVAHADFMTAMMAFFLIMWLINSTDSDIKKSIANYFNPVQLAESVTNRKGLNDPEATKADGPDGDGEERSTLKKPGTGEAKAAETRDHEQPASEKAAAGGESPEAKERAAFQDPYAVLAKLETEAESTGPTSPDPAVAEIGVSGMAGEVYRDPFDPVYWQMAASDGSRTNAAGATPAAEPVSDEGAPDAGAAPPSATAPPADISEQPSAPRTGNGPSPSHGPLHTGSGQTPVAAEAAAAAKAAEAAAKLIEAELAEALQASLGSSPSPNLDVRVTDEGILVSLTDDIDFSMFDIGSAVPNPKVVVAMVEVAAALAQHSGDIVIRGFTDGRPFRSDTYDNWRLSSARAHMAYYMLTRGGLDESRIRQIEGHADRDLKNPDDPNAAENRRIEILLKGAVS